MDNYEQFSRPWTVETCGHVENCLFPHFHSADVYLYRRLPWMTSWTNTISVHTGPKLLWETPLSTFPHAIQQQLLFLFSLSCSSSTVGVDNHHPTQDE